MQRPDIGPAERAALRAQARAVDISEAAESPDLLTKANLCYLELRKAAGLVAGAVKSADGFDQFLAELARPGAANGSVGS